jgi:hypothetical protein
LTDAYAAKEIYLTIFVLSGGLDNYLKMWDRTNFNTNALKQKQKPS